MKKKATSRELTLEFGQAFTLRSLYRAIQFYLTELPPLPLLRQRPHQAIAHARENAARRLLDSRVQ